MPKNTPAEFVNAINKATHAALADPKVKARFATLGVEPMPLTPAGFTKFIQDDFDKWSNVIKTTGIKVD
jgi:tripartite-type tricarboxylate transporter receptor subunit TctC